MKECTCDQCLHFPQWLWLQLPYKFYQDHKIKMRGTKEYVLYQPLGIKEPLGYE